MIIILLVFKMSSTPGAGSIKRLTTFELTVLQSNSLFLTDYS